MIAFRSTVCLLGLCLLTPDLLAADAKVRIENEGTNYGVFIGDEKFAHYISGGTLPKPIFHPVYGKNEDVLTTYRASDHEHHQGVWVSLDEVNEVNFWGSKLQKKDAVTPEDGKESLIETLSVESRHNVNGTAALEVQNQWLGKEGRPMLRETTSIIIHPNRLLTYHITLKALDEPVTFADTKEGFLGVRVAQSMREREGGHIVNADGLREAKNAWGKPSAWVDYYGEVNGHVYGVALMDHPDNFRKSRYHVRDYGLFSVSPFGEKAYTSGANPPAPVTLAPGEEVSVRYGVYFHEGDTEAADVAGAYDKYLTWTK